MNRLNSKEESLDLEHKIYILYLGTLVLHQVYVGDTALTTDIVLGLAILFQYREKQDNNHDIVPRQIIFVVRNVFHVDQ